MGEFLIMQQVDINALLERRERLEWFAMTAQQ